ncbi:Na/Pi cotransporter family protein [Accumulibacter sp.]|uniref:Na/Pi cotransporter family protein n=1 Tax=Accumulibacter sp. TaxID=2053492 RepID=UPI0025DB1B49|nr:Na/Pi cotransporter family protein [Accumulibacter sp.]MCP5229813.1 Na/Pi cotransporter family protein [Accumulibacter sp.]
MRALPIDPQSTTSLRSSLLRVGLPVLLAVAFSAFAVEADVAAQSPDWVQLFLGLFGGLALFLGGLQLLSEGMKKAAGQALKTVLAKLTTNRFSGALTGAFVTGVLNSSTVTTLLVVGFISAGFMTLAQSVGVIMGANIGSTVTAQLLAFNLSAYSLGPVAIGFFMMFSAKREKVKYYGMMIMGIGLVFYGMGLMSSGMTPLRSYEPFLQILKGLENPLAGIAAGALFTAIVQSSAATVGIAIAMASEGLLALPAGIALALGANIGTAATTAFMGILSSKSAEATRASVVHVAFNVLGTLIWLPVIWLLVDLSVWVSPASPELQGAARAAAEVPRQIANANTLFNVLNTVLFIGFTGWFAKMAERVVPDRELPEGVIVQVQYLDDGALQAPSVALQAVRLELGRVGEITIGMLRDIGPALRDRDLARIEDIARRDDEVDILEAEIFRYLGKIRVGHMTEQESAEMQQLMVATDNIENLADVMETDMVALARKLVNVRSTTEGETQTILIELYESTLKSVELAVKAIRDNDQRAAESVMIMKDTVRDQSERLLERKATRLVADDPDYLDLVRLQMSFVDQMRRIYTLAKRIAKVALPPGIAQKD